MLVRVHNRVEVKIEKLKQMIYADHGAVLVATTQKGKKELHCNCINPCGMRYFPKARTLKDVGWQEVEQFLKRVWPAWKVRLFARNIEDTKIANRRMKENGFFRKGGDPFMLLERIPGPVLRALQHDFPDEFDPGTGVATGEAQVHIEKVLEPFCINREHGPRERKVAV